MKPNHAYLAASVVVAGLLAGGVAYAQAPAASHQSTAAQVESWTTKQWETAKKEWAQNKVKWADCQKQSDKQKLEGRKSWSFLYSCMTSA
jgi:hypothetical protein